MKQQDLQRVLLKHEMYQGEMVALRFRWVIIAVVLMLTISIFLQNEYDEAIKSGIFVGVYAIFNVILNIWFRNKQDFKTVSWISYLSVTVDITMLSLHIYTHSVMYSDIAVSTTATILLYPVMMFLSVLRYDKKLIIYTTIITLVLFNTIYFVRYPDIDNELLTKVISANPMGQLFKSIYLLLFGYFLLKIPSLVDRLIDKQKTFLDSNNKFEIYLELEKQKRKFAQQNFENQKDKNNELSAQNEKIAEQNEQLQQLISMKDKLLSIIGHDLKNPLSVTHSLSELLLDDIEDLDTESLYESLKVINNTSTQGLVLLENLLQWARAQSNRIDFSPQSVLLRHLTQNCIKILIDKAKQKNITIKNNIPKDLFVFGDPNMLETIIRNLLSNAVKFTPNNGRVEIEAVINENKDVAFIRIIDSGVGISEKNIVKLFDTKKHFTTKGTAHEKGTGLGLLLCKEFVERNGGKINVKSKENEGSIFEFSIKMKSEQNITL